MTEASPIETRLGYVTAWRTWRVWSSVGGLSLHSVAAAPALGEWLPLRPMEARCGYREMRPPACECESCPGNDNKCGIYAYREAPSTVTHAMGVVGRVALWGTVIEHATGYRGQFAYPIDVAYGHCTWCGSAERPKLLPFEASVALAPGQGEGWVEWVCREHERAALARLRSLETGKPSQRWAGRPGIEIAPAIAETYSVEVGSP
ncbi:MAG: hypothetical protein OXT51_07210 [Chloroflexota bacterium]|nr:hypothetical protein [Chloroflexota bacterium]